MTSYTTTRGNTYTVGETTDTLPDCGTLTVTAILDGTEHLEDIIVVTGTNAFGQTLHRWVRP